MDKGGPAPAGLWLEIDITQADTEVRVTARGSQGEHPRPHFLGPRFTPDTLRQFGEYVKEAASKLASLEKAQPEAEILHQARKLHEAFFQSELQEVLYKLQGVAGERPLLLRLMPHGTRLQGIPWEALCRPGTGMDFLGTSQQLYIARGVHSTRPWQPREVNGAVRLLVISPSDEDAPEMLRAKLHSSIASGALQWIPPLTGPRARQGAVLDRLRCEPVPHILHFIGHGGLGAQGAPLLKMAGHDDEESWLKAELLAQELEGVFRANLRLVVLEACEGAQPGALASAAELLAQSGADAVVAHLWPVKADVARRCSEAFYHSLSGASERSGDVARSLHDARRTVLGEFQESAEAFSPVLYLRGRDSTLFDFRHRKLAPPVRAPVQPEPVDAMAPQVRALLELLEQPFSLMLGDHLLTDAWASTVEGFRQRLQNQLQKTFRAVPAELPLSALAQRYMLQFGAGPLKSEFRAVFGKALHSLPLVEALARRLKPGFHFTLQRLPILERALAQSQPQLSLYVIQPSKEDKDAPLIQQHTSDQGWSSLPEFPSTFNPEQDIAVVRLYRGYLPADEEFDMPLLTEDDYLLGVRDLKDVLPEKLSSHIQGTLNRRPALLLGLSLLSWDHRHVLQSLFLRRPLPLGSTVLLEPGDTEGESWRKGRGLPGGPSSHGLNIVQKPSAALAAILDTGTMREPA